MGSYKPFRSKGFRDIKYKALSVWIGIRVKKDDTGTIYLKTGNNVVLAESEWRIVSGKAGRKYMYIKNFEVREKYRGKGYGDFLARILIDLARLYHMTKIYLTDSSTLEGFWQNLGFKDNKVNGYSVLYL